jgi:uncharacterized protein YprB with RNaseH-like and TPR domain
MRSLNIEQIQERFDKHQMLHNFEVDELYKDVKHKPFTDIQYRYLQVGIETQLIFDIETSDFNPHSNFIICYNALMRNIATGKLQYIEDSMTKQDIKKAVHEQNFDFDRRLLETLSWNIKQADQIVGHYSTKFDYPYFISRCMLTKQDKLIQPYGDTLHQDTWRLMKRSINPSWKGNTLRNFIKLTGGEDEKTFVDLRYWYITHFKDHKEWQKAMNYIQDHCRKDVKMTYLGLKKAELFNPISRMKC